VLVLWKQSIPLLHKDHELLGHIIQLAEVGVGIDVAVPGADGIVDKQDVGELVPCAIIVHKRLVVLQAIGADLHQGAIFRAASRPAV
jgi:hypothetical protein